MLRETIMFKELEDIESHLLSVNQQLQDPKIFKDQKLYTKLMKEHSTLKEIVDVYQEYKKIQRDITSHTQLLKEESDEELLILAKEELEVFHKKLENLTQILKQLLLPKDLRDDKNIILEIRAGAGGDEASLFAEELFRAYSLYASEKKWKIEILSTSEGNAGGYKEVIAMISGGQVYSRLKYESGVHRVQRVPKTEAQGRIHTSTVTVAVLAEAEDIDIHIDPNDLRIDVYRSSGSGGQHVNTTDSAVRIIHIPTGITVSCQDEKSQLKNKNKAMKVLRARLLDIKQIKAQQEASDQRLSQIGTGDRSERIRTYNFPQSRVTDHRIGLTTHTLNQVMDGQMTEIIDAVQTHFQAQMLSSH